MPNFLVFAGTSEGRRIVEWLAGCGVHVCACVATDYGKSLLPENVEVLAERLDEDQMTALLQAFQFDCVIDATHPYAAAATKNIRAACAAADTRYVRLLRPAGVTGDCVYVETIQQAVDVLNVTTGKVLLTTGSKDLHLFTQIPNYQERIFPRVLPTVESIERCLALGYPVKNIIAMQGPFTRELNGAMMRQIGAGVLVTKESGDAGGISEKLGAVQDAGAIAIVVGRPKEESGMLYEDLVELLAYDFALRPKPQPKRETAYFPMFVDLSASRVILFGGSAKAAHWAAILQPFCASLTVVSPQTVPELETLETIMIRRPYRHGDCAGYDMALAATDNRDVNHAIYEECKLENVPVYVADAPEECSYHLPELVRVGRMIVGISAGNQEEKHAKAQIKEIRARIETITPPEIQSER